jgi:hypothetical protein
VTAFAPAEDHIAAALVGLSRRECRAFPIRKALSASRDHACDRRDAAVCRGRHDGSGGAVGRPIVHDDELEERPTVTSPVVLPADVGDQLPQNGSLVSCGHDDAERWRLGGVGECVGGFLRRDGRPARGQRHRNGAA